MDFTIAMLLIIGAIIMFLTLVMLSVTVCLSMIQECLEFYAEWKKGGQDV